MVDFQHDARRRLSRGQTSSASVRNGHTEDQSSTAVYGLQKRMVHSIASLVNPHAKLAESEAKRAEEEYVRDQQPYRASSSRAYSAKGSNPQDLGSHIPVLRAVSVSSNKGDNVNSFNGFKQDHLYGQDILSLSYCIYRRTPSPITMPPITKVSQPETSIHTQPLEDFYQTAESFCPSPSLRFRVPSRIQSAPGPRVKSSKTISSQGGKTTMGLVTKQKQPPTPHKLGKNLVGNEPLKKEPTTNGDVSKETNASNDRPSSAVKLNTVVNMIDHVKDEMNFFREKLAPTPMSGFRQPSSTNVSSKPLSRPTSTASRKSRPTSHTSRRVRSPSPQGRPSTPTDTENLMMGEPEVPSDTFRHSNLNLARPHSATVNKAVDWRGKVTPESARIRSKSRMGSHTYVQKLKPSLRTAGATSAGNRPKTAPISVQERWNTKSKECDKNQRIPQAASHTITEINDKDMDQIMNIKYIMGSSDDSRYGSMGDLFLDEEFLRSLNTRYTSSTSLANSVQTKEYVSFVGPTPRMSPVDSRSQSRQTFKKPEIQQIPEESSVREDQSETAADPEEAELEHDKENQNPEDNVIQQTDPRSWKSPNRYPGEPVTDGDLTETEVGDTVRSEVKNTPRSDGSKFSREVATKLESGDHEGQVHIEVTGLTAPGRPLTPPKDLGLSLQGLSQSDVWQYQPDVELQAIDSQPYLDGHDHSYHHHHHHHHHQGSKSFVRPENYCFHCLPDNMSTKVGRSAGRMPGGPMTPSGQVLRMSRRQNEHYKKTPPTRSAPSIPSPHHPLGGRTPGQGQGQQYFSELEHHARKERSPRHYMEQENIRKGSTVVDLRKDTCHSAPPGMRTDMEDMGGSLSVISLSVADRAQTAPLSQKPNISQSIESFTTLAIHHEVAEADEDVEQDMKGAQLSTGEVGTKPTVPRTPASQSIAHIGRPIAQVSKIPDPEEELQAVSKQKEAKAAVDIQRIFRGYVCRNSYRKLLWENRKNDEDKQLLLQESQREHKRHLSRKAQIYNRPPLDPELLQWACNFKQIQQGYKEKREAKMDSMAQEMLANQQKAKSKIEVIGPHVEIYDIYHPKETGPSKRDMHKAAVKIQTQVRGFLVRRRFEKLRRKATFCGTTWKNLVKEYKQLLVRVQHWHGKERAVTPFSLTQMYDYMDMRRRYESQFDKKAFGSELELADLEAFFRECDLYPSKTEIDEGLDVITQGQILKKGRGLQKNEAMNLLFYIYVPPATGLENTRQSTWMSPIIDGVEAKKLLGNEFVERAPLAPCADLVIQSRRDRRMKEEMEMMKEDEMKRGKTGSVSSDDSEGKGHKKGSEKGDSKGGSKSKAVKSKK